MTKVTVKRFFIDYDINGTTVDLEFVLEKPQKEAITKSGIFPVNGYQGQATVQALNDIFGFQAQCKTVSSHDTEDGHCEVIFQSPDGSLFTSTQKFKRGIEIPDAAMKAYFNGLELVMKDIYELEFPPLNTPYTPRK